jgi:hypothetical protein
MRSYLSSAYLLFYFTWLCWVFLSFCIHCDCFMWCPGPESNRHGIAPEGFSYPTTAFAAAFLVKTHLWSGLYLCPVGFDVGRNHQVSTLSSWSNIFGLGLSSGLPPPKRAEVPPTLAPFTRGVSDLGAQFILSPLRLPIPPPGLELFISAHFNGNC